MNALLLHNPKAMKEYNFTVKFIKLINDLAYKLGMINYYNYRFRFDQTHEYVIFLDLDAVFSSNQTTYFFKYKLLLNL